MLASIIEAHYSKGYMENDPIITAVEAILPKEGAWQEYKPAMHKLMLVIANEMSDNPEWWIQNVFISKWSSLWDFFGDEQEIIDRIYKAVGVEPIENHNLGSIADKMNLLPEFIGDSNGSS